MEADTKKADVSKKKKQISIYSGALRYELPEKGVFQVTSEQLLQAFPCDTGKRRVKTFFHCCIWIVIFKPDTSIYIHDGSINEASVFGS